MESSPDREAWEVAEGRNEVISLGERERQGERRASSVEGNCMCTSSDFRSVMENGYFGRELDKLRLKVAGPEMKMETERNP